MYCIVKSKHKNILNFVKQFCFCHHQTKHDYTSTLHFPILIQTHRSDFFKKLFLKYMYLNEVFNPLYKKFKQVADE